MMTLITPEQIGKLTRKQKLELIELLEAKVAKKAGNNLIKFTQATFHKFDLTWFHERYYKVLNDFAEGRIKKLMVFMPPQHGKSQGSTRQLPAYLLGKNPDNKVAILCYNATKASKFNREIQRIMMSAEYQAIFPNTRLATKGDGSYTKTMTEFEIVDHDGGLKSVGVGGALTGDPVDTLIMDDLYKDAKEAWSPTVRENVNEWYDTVAETRLHNGSQQLLVFTRWHEHDLAGRLLSMEDDWHVVLFEAIKTTAPTDFDPRQIGEPLYPSKHSLEKLIKVRARNPMAFQSLYQGDPKPKEGYMYAPFRTHSGEDSIPFNKTRYRKNYTDTADKGTDYLCGIDYIETETAMYVIDVLYTQKPMKDTEPMSAIRLAKNKIQLARYESNNGGEGHARNVETQTRVLKNLDTTFETFHQSDNKEVRIFTNSAKVNNMVYMPEGWDKLWPEFYNAVVGYLKAGKNPHDDAPDALTGLVEWFGKDTIKTINPLHLGGFG